MAKYDSEFTGDLIGGAALTGLMDATFALAFWGTGPDHAISFVIFMVWFIGWSVALLWLPIGSYLWSEAQGWNEGRKRILKANVDAKIAEIEIRSKLLQEKLKSEQQQFLDAMKETK